MPAPALTDSGLQRLIQIRQYVLDGFYPTDSRIISGFTPALACSASLNWRWVVEAGWQASDWRRRC